jgi:hypothetical protein
MKRLLMLVGVAVVAAAMYVSVSPASQQSRGPTAKQFKALKKQVAILSKTLKTVKGEASASVDYIGACLLIPTGPSTFTIAALPVSQFGSSSDGFMYGANPATATPRTGLDIETADPQVYLQEVTSKCIGNSAPLRRGASRWDGSRLQLWADRGH